MRDLEQAHIVNKDSSIIHQIRNVKQEIDKILSEGLEEKIRLMEQRYYESGPRVEIACLEAQKTSSRDHEQPGWYTKSI